MIFRFLYFNTVRQDDNALGKYRKKAVEEGIEKGQNRLALLVGRLLETGRMDDLKRVSYDEAYREKLLKEFGL